MKPELLQSVYSGEDEVGIVFVVSIDGRYQFLDIHVDQPTKSETVPVSVGLNLKNKDDLEQDAPATPCCVENCRTRVFDRFSSQWSRCFGDAAGGTIRARERRALRMASMQALIDLLNQP